MSSKTPVIAIVGRPNVGKSTLFNRVFGERKAIVEDESGVTRDRNYALVERFSVPFILIDTGGIDSDANDVIGKQVLEQALVAAEEADVIIVMFDGSTGCLEGDKEVVRILRKYNKPTYYVVNKCDGDEQVMYVSDFYTLGISEFQDISALHGRRVQVLMEKILEQLPNYSSLFESLRDRKEREKVAIAKLQQIKEVVADLEEIVEPFDDDDEEEEPLDLDENGEPVEEEFPNFAPVFLPDNSDITADQYDRQHSTLSLDESVDKEDRSEEIEIPEELLAEDAALEETPVELECIKVAIVGRPNVGKSTLLNVLSGTNRAITSPLAGTTRDNLDLEIKRDGQKYLIVDTAGMRKKGKVEENVERYSVMRAVAAISDCDVAVVVIDAEEGPSEQDSKIVGLAHEAGRGLIIAVNKWDLVEKNHKTVNEYTLDIKEAFKFAPYAQIIYISALSGRRCPRVLETAKEVALQGARRISTGKLNPVLQKAMRRFSPAPYRGNPVKLYYAVQTDVRPPRFILFFNYPRTLHFSFLRFLKNAIRDEFGFEGTDIKIHPKRK